MFPDLMSWYLRKLCNICAQEIFSEQMETHTITLEWSSQSNSHISLALFLISKIVLSGNIPGI